jgi:ATP-binding cassette, subfamily B (MDR/TAP), member 1
VRFITSSMFVQGFWYGSYLVRTGQSSPGKVVTTFWSCLMATKAFEDILPHLIVLEKGRAAGIELKTILKQVGRGKKLARITTGITPKFCEGDIEIRQVCIALSHITNESWLTLSGLLCLPFPTRPYCAT